MTSFGPEKEEVEGRRRLREFEKFLEALPRNLDLKLIPVKDDKSPDVRRKIKENFEEIRLSKQEARERIQEGKNVGIYLGNYLCCLDVDKPKEAEEILELLPNTLVVSSRSGKPHIYYLRGKGIEGTDYKDIVELRTGWRYVLVPGSYAYDREEYEETGEKRWGLYTVRNSEEIAKLKRGLLPDELKKDVIPETEVDTEAGESEKEIKTGDGKSLRELRENDEKLDDLLSELNPESHDYPSRSEADQALMVKLVYYGFNVSQICQIVREYRPYEKTEREDYLETTLASAIAFLEKRGEIAVPTDDLEEKLEKRASDLSKYSWKCPTKFVTFAKDVMLGSLDRKIEKESTLELPTTLVEELEDGDIAAEKVWKCKECGALRTEWPEEPECPECGGSRTVKVGKKKVKRAPYFLISPQEWLEIGEAFLKNYRFAVPRETVTETKPGRIHIFDRGVDKSDGAKGFIRAKVKQINPKLTQADQKHVIDHIATKTMIPESQFGVGGEKVVVENGILDLSEMKLKNHDPDEHALAKISVPYNPDAGEPTLFLESLKVWFPKKEDRLRVQEVMGTALVGEKLHKKGLVLVGPTDAGKSTFVKIPRGVIGIDNLSTQSPKSLADTRWGKARLRSVLLNATDEMSAGKIYNLDVLKKILDGNPIDGERKNEKLFEFTPTCEHIYACNQTPTANRRDDAFWNRWIVVEVPKEIPEDDQDPNLAEKILEKEKEGILNWMIEGYKRFKKNGNKFTNPQDWTEARDKWLNWGDSVQRFIEKCVIKSEDRDFKVTSRDIYEIYSTFTEEKQNLDLRDQKVLTGELKKLPYSSYSDSYRIDGKKQRGFKGVDVDLTTLTTLTPLSFVSQKCEILSRGYKRGEGEDRGQRGQKGVDEVEDLGALDQPDQKDVFEEILNYYHEYGDPDWTVSRFLDPLTQYFNESGSNLDREGLKEYVLRLKKEGKITLMDELGEVEEADANED